MLKDILLTCQSNHFRHLNLPLSCTEIPSINTVAKYTLKSLHSLLVCPIHLLRLLSPSMSMMYMLQWRINNIIKLFLVPLQ